MFIWRTGRIQQWIHLVVDSFLIGRVSNTTLIACYGPFKLFPPSRFKFGRSYVSGNLSSCRFFIVLEYRFSMYIWMILWIARVSVAVSPLSFLIFFSLSFGYLAKSLPLLFIFSKSQALFHWSLSWLVAVVVFLYRSFHFHFINIYLIFIVSFDLLSWGLVTQKEGGLA